MKCTLLPLVGVAYAGQWVSAAEGKTQRAKGRLDAGTPRVVSRQARAQAGTGWWFGSPGPRRDLDACARPPEKAVRGGVTSGCRGLSFSHAPWSVGDALAREPGTGR